MSAVDAESKVLDDMGNVLLPERAQSVVAAKDVLAFEPEKGLFACLELTHDAAESFEETRNTYQLLSPLYSCTRRSRALRHIIDRWTQVGNDALPVPHPGLEISQEQLEAAIRVPDSGVVKRYDIYDAVEQLRVVRIALPEILYQLPADPDTPDSLIWLDQTRQELAQIHIPYSEISRMATRFAQYNAPSAPTNPASI